MIALALFINLLSHITCQQLQQWPSFPESSQPGFQQLFLGADNDPHLQNLPNFQEYNGYIPQPTFPSSQLSPRSELSLTPSFPSPDPRYTLEEYISSIKRIIDSHTPVTSNLDQRSKITSEFPNTYLSTIRAPQSFEPATYSSLTNSQFIPSSPQITQPQFQLPPPSFPSVSSSAVPFQMPFPAIPSSVKASRSIIPSPLTDNIPLSYPYRDPFMNMFELPEPGIKSVGCLDLAMTPYGTISETRLPDPSIPLPRSPFLPVSSPVSALAPPSSPYLPSVIPSASSSNFLRKVPIPPPFI